MTSVDATGVKNAIELARAEVSGENKVSTGEDFFVICVLAGEHQDIKDQE